VELPASIRDVTSPAGRGATPPAFHSDKRRPHDQVKQTKEESMLHPCLPELLLSMAAVRTKGWSRVSQAGQKVRWEGTLFSRESSQPFCTLANRRRCLT
jgi:hypothetical protein